MFKFNTLISMAPIAGAIIVAAISFGELSAKVTDLQNQCGHMQQQLDVIQQEIMGHK